MKNLIQTLTGTKNATINSVIVLTLLFISVLLIAFIINVIVDPSHIANASF
jgi:hypothetical protein